MLWDGIFFCVILSGNVKCSGAFDQANIPSFKNPRKLVADVANICVLDDEGVHCIGNGASNLNYNKIPSNLVRPTEIFTSWSFSAACAQDENGLHCWNNFGSANDFSSLGQGKFALGANQLCVLSLGSITCVDQENKKLNVPKLSNPTDIYMSPYARHICARDDSGVVCWGNETHGEISLKIFDSISAGFASTCVSSYGKLRCWGSGLENLNHGLPPSDGENSFDQLFKVSLGNNFVCLNNDGPNKNLACFGDDQKITKSVPNVATDTNGYFMLPLVASGYAHMCYATSRGVQCFGANEFGESTPPLGLIRTDGENLAAGGHHTCMIDSEAEIKCWGQNTFGQTLVPSGITNPVMVTAGFSHSCALADSGVVCWGNNLHGQTNVPALKHPRLVRAGGFHTCAVDDDGAKCWGDNSFGQSSVPANLKSKISEIATGYLHTCAIIL